MKSSTQAPVAEAAQRHPRGVAAVAVAQRGPVVVGLAQGEVRHVVPRAVRVAVGDVGRPAYADHRTLRVPLTSS